MVFRTILGRRYNVSNSRKATNPMSNEIVALIIAWSIVVACFIIETITRR
jgi:hypothetical protein